MKSYPVQAFLYSRFSSADQRRGNSLARQTEFATDFCVRKGITLDQTLTFTDSGVSGHRGKNHQTGALSLFLKACEQGRIARGSYLIVENLDRLSRENPLDALHLLRTLLNTHGITLVTIHPATEMTAKNFDMIQGVMAFIELGRGHSESAAKSVRSKDNWMRKRNAIKDGKPVTSITPAWVKTAGGKMVLDEKKAATVRRIFELSARGIGQRVICRMLIEEGVPPLGKASTWHESYVQKLLTGRTVLGEYQPCVRTEGGRTPAGPAVPDYYPRVIPDDLWQRSREAMGGRRHQRGRITRTVGNLFTGLAWEDGHRLQYHAKGSWGPFLQTSSRQSPGLKYQPFEKAVLWFLRSVQVREGTDTTFEDLKRQADKLDASARKLQAQIENDPGMADMLPTLAKWKKEHRETLEKMQSAAVPAQARHLHTVRLVEALATAKGDELETLRREVRQAVRQVVERIDVDVFSATRPVPAEDANGIRLDLPAELPGSWRVVRVGVKLTTGRTHHIVYVAEFNRLAAGAHVGTTDGTHIDQVDQGPAFPVDPPTKRSNVELREKCLAMRAEGMSYPAIAAALGIHPVTANRYVIGRNDDKKRPRKAASAG